MIFVLSVPVCSIQDDEQTVPSSYAHVVCSQFAQLGARGVSVFFGSGDGGVSGVQAPGSCKSNVNNQTAFIPLFPSSCPYVTSVGGKYGMSVGCKAILTWYASNGEWLSPYSTRSRRVRYVIQLA